MPSTAAPVDVVVIGAGMAGLTAAARLEAEGRTVTVLDKGRGVGGRMATRRVDAAVYDHGAQFFTARSEWFRERVEAWVAAGVAREWCRGFRTPPDGHPRYVGQTGMTAVAKHLAAGLAEVRTATRVTSVARADGGWRCTVDDGTSLHSTAVIVTSPVPQTLDLLGAGGVELTPAIAAALAAIRYAPTLAALVAPPDPAVPAPGGVQVSDGPISWIGDNAAKGISPVPAVTLHAAPDESAARYDDDADATLAAMVAAVRRWVGEGRIEAAQLVRWRYAQPTVSHDERHLVASDGGAPLVAAGDAFGEAKVEGAARSGWEAAAAVLERIGAA